MKMKIRLLVLFLIGASSLAQAQYFLSSQQKGQLLWYGRIQDEKGKWYDVTICPGYRAPAVGAGIGWKNSGRDLKEYGDPELYRSTGDLCEEVLEWSYEDCLVDFTFEGTGRAWKKYFGQAAIRTEKRTFGWWLSYPWAFCQGTVDNLVRIPCGLAGTAGGTLTGIALIPAWNGAAPAAKSLWHAGIDGTGIPLVQMTWNTGFTPMLALTGQRPAEQRVDGWWLRRVSDPLTVYAPDQKAYAVLTEYASALLDESAGASEKIREEDTLYHQELEKVRQEHRQRRDELQAERNRKIAGFLENPEYANLGRRLRKQGWSARRVRENREDFFRFLKQCDDPDLYQKRYEIMSLLTLSLGSDARMEELAPRPVSDPVSGSAEVINNIGMD